MTRMEMTDYYVKRASEYEYIYQKPERQTSLKHLQTTLAEAFDGLDILEVLKNFPTQNEYNEQIKTFAEHYNFIEMDCFRIARYTLKSITEQIDTSCT